MKKVEQVYKEMRPLVERWLEEQKAEARQKAILEGRVEGLRTALERVLVGRFGPVGDEVRERLNHADEEQLCRWLEQAGRASSLEDVFGTARDDGQSG